MKVLTTSENPVKINATKTVFGALHTAGIIPPPIIYEARNMPSGVGHTPFNEEIKAGAAYRTMNAYDADIECDFIISFEGGVEYKKREIFYCTAFCCVMRTSDMKAIFAQTPNILLPHAVRDLLHAGWELGPAMDKVFDMINSKQAGGVVGTFTHGMVKRIDTYTQTLAHALAPFFHHAYPGL